LTEFYQQVDHKTIDEARLVSKADDPAGYMTLVDISRDSGGSTFLEELQGIIAKYSD
jgi:hypothetical protein